MKFGSVPLDEARGAILAHSQRAGERMIRKGTLLDEAALAALAEAGAGAPCLGVDGDQPAVQGPGYDPSAAFRRCRKRCRLAGRGGRRR